MVGGGVEAATEEYGYGTSAEAQRAQVAVTGTGNRFSFNVIGSWEDYGDYTAADGASAAARHR